MEVICINDEWDQYEFSSTRKKFPKKDDLFQVEKQVFCQCKCGKSAYYFVGFPMYWPTEHFADVSSLDKEIKEALSAPNKNRKFCEPFYPTPERVAFINKIFEGYDIKIPRPKLTETDLTNILKRIQKLKDGTNRNN